MMKEAQLDYFRTECKSIVLELKRQEQLLQLKRRLLIGVRMSKSERKMFLKARCLPESVLREDDHLEVAKFKK
ncbi:hypothetical protein LINPERPRIM_LOCUS18745, partial [Linum perenne]